MKLVGKKLVHPYPARPWGLTLSLQPITLCLLSTPYLNRRSNSFLPLTPTQPSSTTTIVLLSPWPSPSGTGADFELSTF